MAEDSPTPIDPIEALRAALGSQYAVERRLGQGGMGAVYLARDVTLDRPVAIKVISPDVASHVSLRDRFLQEARTVAKLRHPNIVPVFAAGDANGVLYFVMEYVPGESLRDLLTRDGRLPADKAEGILREMALALDHAHALGLVHRDIKPENILIDAESGRAMLTDFGVARAFEQEGGLTQTGMILGSPRYMSPEQASGDRAIDGRSDLYALALVGYEMFTGAPVVQANTAAAMLVKHLTETPPPLAEKVEGVPARVAAAIDRGLEKDPDARWQRGSEFAAALGGGPVSSAPAPTAVRRSYAGPVGALAVLAAVFAWFMVSRTSAPTGSAYVVAPFEIQSGDPSVRWLREGSVNMLTLTLGQWADLNVVNYERTLSLLDAAGFADKERLTLDDARNLARRGDAATVVTGQVQTTRDSLIVIARLFDVRSGRELQQAQEGAPIADDPRPLFDRLAQRLLAIAGGPVSTVQLTEATTSSIEAYRAYLDGVRLLNSWQLVRADSAFTRAISLDSTFALAYHKRSLGLGWSEVSSPAYRESAARAVDLGGRLPPRERALVQGHFHLTQALGATDSAAVRAYDDAIAVYRDLLARDSLVAEAWYGLADAYFHGRPTQPTTAAQADYITRSLRAFNRTLAIDSTFHLAYSHLVQVYNDASRPGMGVLLLGDSAVFVDQATAAQRFGGAAGVQRLRDSARIRGTGIAKAWMRADVNSVQPHLQLAETYRAAQQFDSAVRVLESAMQRPATASPALRMVLLNLQLTTGDTAFATTLRYVLDRYTRDSLRLVPLTSRMDVAGAMIAAAAATGRAADVDRAIALFVATDSTFPGSSLPTATTLGLYRLALGVAMGEPMTPGTRHALAGAVRGYDAIPGPTGQQARSGSTSIPLFAFVMSRDTAFSNALARWSGTAYPELDALTALDRGDTAAAERIAQAFAPADSLRLPSTRFGSGGIRTMARAQVLAALGRTRQAAETYEAMDIARINRAALAEPGYALWVRSHLERARLWRQLNERDRAIAAYEEFIRRWSDADGAAAAQVQQARQELAALRDR